MTRGIRYWPVSLCLLLGTGCYTYAPVQSPTVGMEVRARLTGEAAARRSQGLDEPVVRLDGTIVESSSEALSLNVLVARSSSAFQDVVIRDTVRLETTEIQSILQRKLSLGRTALVVLGAGAAAAGIVLGIDQIVGGTDEPPDGGDPNLRARRIAIPLFRFR